MNAFPYVSYAMQRVTSAYVKLKQLTNYLMKTTNTVCEICISIGWLSCVSSLHVQENTSESDMNP